MQQKVFYNLLFNPDGEYNDYNLVRFQYIWNLEDLQEKVNKSIETYYGLEDEDLLDYYSNIYVTDENGE